MTDIGVAIARYARSTPHAVAAFEGERELSYAELDARTNRLANALHGRYGVRPGDRVAVLLRNRLEVAEAIGGVTKAGAVYCGLNFRMSLEEYRAILANAEPPVLVTEAGFGEYAAALAEEFGVAVLDVDGADWALADAAASPPGTLHGRARMTGSASSTPAARPGPRRASCSTRVRRPRAGWSPSRTTPACRSPWPRRSCWAARSGSWTPGDSTRRRSRPRPPPAGPPTPTWCRPCSTGCSRPG